ncbi:glycosyltransferase family 2 protein [Escherichia marmotae]|uniref:glycosyltransferase n=1 Tax=Escherichia marmotae TaxID=1499973 RepID=UPI00164F47FD|nr:glycosyltransferase [Escherichia marmotae]HAH3395497.1 glycosyltransferase family 2 protein [Escherichia coli]MDQ9212146.1 glycosyltransferase family 2 protein [Escherichia marmotae]MDQ9266144.1 glycosyltransferase family 2 protein [Escherichia marmotae]MDQ9272968.1 glycosyltransferase family 2 protein [Escherichia marmotae]MDQ9310930.1 glycosyltransferase family 2 protein [Escherichia marmotae]
MKTYLFFCIAVSVLSWLLFCMRRKPSTRMASVDAVVPAYNEAPCLEHTLEALLRNSYINKVICVNDGSTDSTPSILDRMKIQWQDKLIVVHQKNTGKGGALMSGIARVSTQWVFLTDADTYVPPNSNGLGYMLAELERGADAVGGIPSSYLKGAGLLPHIRATVKLPMIVLKRTFQQIVGGAPFIISGACGMFRREIFNKCQFSDRTRVEDLDLTWTLISRGYRVRQSSRCVVYPQECNTLRDEWKRWRRWIVGYAVCMRLHKSLLFTRFGIFSIFPMFLVVIVGTIAYTTVWGRAAFDLGLMGIIMAVFPLLWVSIVMIIGVFSAWYHQRWVLIFLAPLSVFYVLLAYIIWSIYGFIAFFSGSEPERDKPTRYLQVVEYTRKNTSSISPSGNAFVSENK